MIQDSSLRNKERIQFEIGGLFEERPHRNDFAGVVHFVDLDTAQLDKFAMKSAFIEHLHRSFVCAAGDDPLGVQGPNATVGERVIP